MDLSRSSATVIETHSSAKGVITGTDVLLELFADRARAGGTSHEKVPRHCQLMD